MQLLCYSGSELSKIRFPEFQGEYINDSLSEISDRVRRKNSENQTDIPLTIASIEGLVDQRTYFGKTVASKDMSGYYLLQNGEFAYNKSYSKGFPVGSIKRLDKYAQGALSTLYICFALKEDADVTSDYLVQYFNSPAWYEAVNEVCAEGARNHGLLNVSPDDFFATTHHFAPTKEEQDKVAAFLSLYDQKIENQMAKVEALETRRKGLLQQIFSQEIRFKADDGSEFPDWDTRAIEDMFNAVSEKNHPEKTVLTIIQGCGTIPRSESDRTIAYNEKNTHTYKLVRVGEFIVHMRSFEGGLELANREGIVSPAYTILHPVVDMDCGFYKYYFRSGDFIKKQLTPITEGIRDGRHLNMDDFWLLEIPYPSIPEQRKIGQFMDLINRQIQIEKDKLEAIKLVKKGLLQQMFV